MADAVYIQLKDAEVFDTKDVSTDVFMDVDEDDEPVGIEILHASKRFTFDLIQAPVAVA